jgi:hypothetical protein
MSQPLESLPIFFPIWLPSPSGQAASTIAANLAIKPIVTQPFLQKLTSFVEAKPDLDNFLKSISSRFPRKSVS